MLLTLTMADGGAKECDVLTDKQAVALKERGLRFYRLAGQR